MANEVSRHVYCKGNWQRCFYTEEREVSWNEAAADPAVHQQREGSSARLTPATKDAPVDAVIVGIVDTVEVGGKVLEKP